MGSLFVIELKIFPQFCYVFFLKHVIVLKVMTLMNKKFGKYEVCDGFHNSSLIVCNFLKKIQSSSHIQKDVFHDQCYIDMLKKVESRAPLTWTWKKMSTLTSFKGFCAFVQFFAFKNKLRKFPKWIL